MGHRRRIRRKPWRTRQERLTARRAERDAYLADPANVFSDEAWREHGPCEWPDQIERCDGGGYCDGSCHDRPLVNNRKEAP